MSRSSKSTATAAKYESERLRNGAAYHQECWSIAELERQQQAIAKEAARVVVY